MAYDYTDDVAFAQEMIAEFGRSVDFVRLSPIAADPTKPLHGPAVNSSDVVMAVAAFVEPSSIIRLGASSTTNEGLWKNSQQIALVGAVEGHDLLEFHQINDNNIIWKITHVEAFKPGDTLLLYYVGVKR